MKKYLFITSALLLASSVAFSQNGTTKNEQKPVSKVTTSKKEAASNKNTQKAKPLSQSVAENRNAEILTREKAAVKNKEQKNKGK